MTKEVKRYVEQFKDDLKKETKKHKPTTKVSFRVYEPIGYFFYILQAWWIYGRKTKQYPKGSKFRTLNMRVDDEGIAKQVLNYLKKTPPISIGIRKSPVVSNRAKSMSRMVFLLANYQLFY